MNLETLYDYLKLLVPNTLKVDKGSDFITVSRPFGSMYVLDVYYLKGEFIVLSAMNYELNKYAKVIFGKPVDKETGSTYNEYFFKIPEGLQ